MSEITTGIVTVKNIKVPAKVGTSLLKTSAAATVNAAVYAAKYSTDKYEKMLDDIRKTDERLKWLDTLNYDSPVKIAKEIKELQNIVINNQNFQNMTNGMKIGEKNILSIAIATENSPLKNYVTKYLDETSKNKILDMDNILLNSAKDMANENFNYVNKIIEEAAKAAGFTNNVKVIKRTNNVTDIVFVDNQNRKLTAYSRLNNELNPAIALDLEGFSGNEKTCSLKMNEIIKYLNDHGVSFNYKELTHNKPEGVLRNLLNKKYNNSSTNGKNIQDYLTGENKLNNNTKQSTI